MVRRPPWYTRNRFNGTRAHRPGLRRQLSARQTQVVGGAGVATLSGRSTPRFVAADRQGLGTLGTIAIPYEWWPDVRGFYSYPHPTQLVTKAVGTDGRAHGLACCANPLISPLQSTPATALRPIDYRLEDARGPLWLAGSQVSG